MLEAYHRYIKDVTAGKTAVCKYVQQAVGRQLRDLKRQKDPTFPYYFDEAAAERAIKIIGLFRHTSGEWQGRPFEIRDFQAFRWACVFGWKKRSDGLRRFRRVYIEVARKQGKTEEAAAIGNLFTTFDGEGRAQVFSAATTRDQAKEVFAAAQIMARYLVEDSPAYAERISVQAHRIVDHGSDSFFTALSAEDKKLDGKNPHLSIVDEYHAHPTNAVLKVLETGMGARRQPLSYIITTAGFNKEGPCFHLRKSIIDILAGRKEDETTFGIIYTLDTEDSWHDKTCWVKANPSIGETPKWDFMESEYTKAVNEGGRSEVEFKTKNLNIWTDAEVTWIQDEVWQAAGTPFDPEELKGRICFGGLDLASTRDINALALIFPPKKGEKMVCKCLFYFWCPQVNAELRTKNDSVDYLKWAEEGYIELTPGNITDYNYLKRRITAMSDHRQGYNIHSIAYDRWNASQLVIDLNEEITGPMDDEGKQLEFMQPFGQGYASMNAPCVELDNMVSACILNPILLSKGAKEEELSMELHHGGNPVTRWMCSNVMLKVDPAGSIKIDKGKSSEKVDGMVALAMAIGQYMTYKHQIETAYSDCDIINL